MTKLRLSLALSFLTAACTHVPGGTDETGPDAALSPDAGFPPDGLALRTRLVGTVVDLDRHGFPGAAVKLCGAACRQVTTDAAGLFEFTEVPSANYGLRVELPGAKPLEYGRVVLPVYYLDPLRMPVRTVPPTVLPRLGGAQALTAGKQTVAIDASLSLGLDAEALTLPAGSPRQLAGVRVAPALYPDFCLPSSDGRILAEWALAPFGAESSAPIEVHIADGLGLAAGRVVNLLTIDPESGTPQVQGTAKVAADGRTIDAVAPTGIRRLTWLIVALPGGGA